MEKVDNQRNMNAPLSPTVPAPPTCIQPKVTPKSGQAGQYTNKMRFFKKQVLDQLTKRKFASPFMLPVDTKVLKWPNYYQVIRSPMDVGTISQRVENNYYRSVEQAIEDFRQIVRNCYKFHSPGTPIYRNGVKMEKFFDRTIAKMPVGPPVPCDKKPKKVVSKPARSNPITEAKEQVEASTNELAAKLPKYFKSQWYLIFQQMDGQSRMDLYSRVVHISGLYWREANEITEKIFCSPVIDEDLSISVAEQILFVDTPKFVEGKRKFHRAFTHYSRHLRTDQASQEAFRASIFELDDTLNAFKEALLKQELLLKKANPSSKKSLPSIEELYRRFLSGAGTPNAKFQRLFEKLTEE